VNKIDPEPPGYAAFQILRRSLEPLPYWRMEPSNHLAVGGPCLALPGEAYALFAERPQITVNLHDLDGAAKAEWINTWTGVRESFAVEGAAVRKLNKPESFGKAPGLLIIRKEN
jgi:hypothetical protein